MTSCTGMQEAMLDGEGRARPVPDAQLSVHLRACGECAAVFRGLASVERALDGLAGSALPEVPAFAALGPRAAAAARGQRRRAGLHRLRPLLVLTLSSAAAVLLVVALVALKQRPAQVGLGDELDASRGARAALLHSGARLSLESGRLWISGSEREERVQLESGAVSVQVPSLPPGALVSVVTPDGEVVAHGTRFRVEHSPEGTRVALREGKVVLHPRGAGRPEVVLLPGQSALIEPLATYRERQRGAASAALGQGRDEEAAAALAKLLATDPSGALAGEAHAMMGWVHQVRAEPAAAANEYRQALLLAKGDAELWADNAAAELALLEEQRGARAGSAAWSAYLARFPAGLHRSLAGSHLERLRAR